jgi:hypothetical protein
MRMASPRFAIFVLAASTAIGVGSHSQEQQTRTRSEFMRRKLDYAKNVIEGLALEDFPLIAKNARSLRAMSRAAEWEVPMIPDVESYLAYSTEFQRVTDDMIRKAEARNLDGATLDYVRMTTSCVNCHKYVRSATR